MPDHHTTYYSFNNRGIFNLVGKDKTDPFVSGALGAARIFKTRVIDNDLNPVWDETFSVASASFDICCPRAVKHVYYQMISRIIRSRATLTLVTLRTQILSSPH